MRYKAIPVSGTLDPTLPTRVQVSMFNRNCSEEFLEAILNWLSSEGVTDIELQVSDTLQRHNYRWQRRKNKTRCHQMAIDAGHIWLKKNQNVIQDCLHKFVKVSITKWDFWLNDPDHSAIENGLRNLLITDDGFSRAVDDEIEKYFLYLERSVKPERKKKCLDYLMEEIAVSEVSARAYLTNEIYPGPRFIPEEYLQLRYPNYYSLSGMNFVHVDFDPVENDAIRPLISNNAQSLPVRFSDPKTSTAF